MTTPTKCSGLLGWLFGHKFQPRYDETRTQPPGVVEAVERVMRDGSMRAQLILDESALERVVGAMDSTKEVYIHEVCVRCGAITPRTAEPNLK